MKTNIRLNCFETNSSSSHSITLGKSKDTYLTSILKNGTVTYNDNITPDENGVITLEGGEFGWGYETYNDAYNKANYCAIDFKGDESATSDLIKVIKLQTGAKEVKIDIGDDSYIDHQSLGTAQKIYHSQGVDGLRNFIFNKNSTLIIDNDNH